MTIIPFYGTSLHGSSCSLFLRAPFGKEGKWFGWFFLTEKERNFNSDEGLFLSYGRK